MKTLMTIIIIGLLFTNVGLSRKLSNAYLERAEWENTWYQCYQLSLIDKRNHYNTNNP